MTDPSLMPVPVEYAGRYAVDWRAGFRWACAGQPTKRGRDLEKMYEGLGFTQPGEAPERARAYLAGYEAGQQ